MQELLLSRFENSGASDLPISRYGLTIYMVAKLILFIKKKWSNTQYWISDHTWSCSVKITPFHRCLTVKDFEEGLGFMQSLLEDAIGAPQVMNFLFIFISCFFNVLTCMKKNQSQLGSLDVHILLRSLKRMHNSPIYDECQTQSAWLLTLPWKQTHQDDSNDTPQPHIS